MRRSKVKNIFISHYHKDDANVQQLKKRLRNIGYDVRNSSVDSTKYQNIKPSTKFIQRHLSRCVRWSGTFICLIGEKTHSRPWVNYEINQAHKFGKKIVGIYKHGCSDNVELPKALKKYSNSISGWNSLDKLGNVLDGKPIYESPSSTPASPIYSITRVHC